MSPYWRIDYWAERVHRWAVRRHYETKYPDMEQWSTTTARVRFDGYSMSNVGRQR